MKRILLRILRVPHDPEPPAAGSPDSIRVFRASPRLYYWNLIYWALLQVFAVIGFALVLSAMMPVTRRFPAWLRIATNGMEFLGIAGFLAQMPLGFWKQKLDYEMRWYIVTDRSLRIRSGVWSLQEITMTFANIQKVQLKQGPLQKLLGIATVEVTSAGGGAANAQQAKHGQTDQHAAKFEGVGNAEEIRDLILERLRQYRHDAGLGDQEHTEGISEADAARELLTAARELRADVFWKDGHS